MKLQMQTISFNPAIELSEKGRCLLAVTSFDATNPSFNITDENNSFSISTPRQWSPEGSGETIGKLRKFLELRSQSDIELHVKEMEKTGIRIEIQKSGYKLAGFDYFKNEINAGLRSLKYKDFPGMVFRMKLTYDQNSDILDLKVIAGLTFGYTLQPGLYDISDP